MNKNLRDKWKTIPGVIFPEEESVVTKVVSPKKKRPCAMPPRDYITTKQAADILRSGYNAAQVKLRKREIKSVIVELEGIRRRFWKKVEVEQLADKEPPYGSWEDVKDMLSMEEFVSKVGVGRSTVMRAIRAGKLHSIAYRMPTAQGRQKRLFFTKEEAQTYVAHLKTSSRVERVKKFLGLK